MAHIGMAQIFTDGKVMAFQGLASIVTGCIATAYTDTAYVFMAYGIH